jgi:hypothetical protein
MGNMSFGDYGIGTDNAYPGYPSPDKNPPTEYRGFKIGRVGPHYLYRIVPREGFDIWRSLDGSFTTPEIAKKQIDSWYQECSWAKNADDAYIPREKNSKRGRPTKKQQLAKALEANSSTP